jgi:phage tail-like protein
VDGPVAKRLCERLVHQAMLFEQRQAGEARRRDGDLEVVAAARAILDAQFCCVGKRLLQQQLQRVDRHAAMVAVAFSRPQEGDGARRTRFGMAPATTRSDPYKVFRFLVEIEGLASAAFSEVNGLDSETTVIEFRTGTDPNFARKLPGLTKFSNIVLKRGITQDAELWNWRKRVIDGNVDRRNGSIILMDDSGAEMVRWNFHEGWPCKLQGPHLNAHGNDVAIETLEIAHEGLERA